MIETSVGDRNQQLARLMKEILAVKRIIPASKKKKRCKFWKYSPFITLFFVCFNLKLTQMFILFFMCLIYVKMTQIKGV
ncbi:DUF3967 domain-containing protein [Bacillus wiedmannii]|uniref:DUF3967 domain-containing protein n=1 Tax=Bacillus wiedmannii TaxID=1890302 RepID=UPI001F0980A4|nr:DUF3967 domain-containing protein [Bacillus wiedmannii]MCX3317636.1 hypothetical protein [Bacillus wiedmannii]